MQFHNIDIVMLDMDGTMLDKHFDDYFWEHLVPEKYAEKHSVTFSKAKEVLLSLYRAHEGTLNWTDIDFWSKELDLDIPALKEQIKHLIEVHPYVEDFLGLLKQHKKKVMLVTNAHFKVLDLKLKKTQIGQFFDRCITSFEIGHPKEDIAFWEKLYNIAPFDKDRVAFIDDTCEVLHTAKRYGIHNLILKRKASSKRADKPCPDFYTIEDFRELISLIRGD